MERKELKETYFQYLLYLFDTDDYRYAHKFLKNSKIELEDTTQPYNSTSFKLFITVSPDIFKEFQNSLNSLDRIIQQKFYLVTKISVSDIEFLVDINKFTVIESRIISINTPWEEINQGQDKLIANLQNSSDSLDFQNLGNTARTIMNKLALQVFNPDLHTHTDPAAKLNNGMFKNQLHAFIKTNLKGSKHEQFRKLAEVSIEYVDRSIDFMNSTTHKIGAERHLAEVCVISTVSAVSIIKLINEL